MKDFYDIWLLATQFKFSGITLATAIEKTFERRNTPLPKEPPIALTPEFYADVHKVRQWKAFINRAALTADHQLPTIVNVIESLLMPPVKATCDGTTFSMSWSPGGPWQAE